MQTMQRMELITTAHKRMRVWAESKNDAVLVDVRNGLAKLDPYLAKIGKSMAPDLMILRICVEWYGALLKHNFCYIRCVRCH